MGASMIGLKMGIETSMRAVAMVPVNSGKAFFS